MPIASPMRRCGSAGSLEPRTKPHRTSPASADQCGNENRTALRIPHLPVMWPRRLTPNSRRPAVCVLPMRRLALRHVRCVGAKQLEAVDRGQLERNR